MRLTRDKRKRKLRPLFTCGSCGKSYSNPLGHVCTGGGGLRRKRAAYEKQQKAAGQRARETAARQARRAREDDARKTRRQREEDARRARREKEAATAKARRTKTAAPRRAGRPAHDYARCRDHDCQRANRTPEHRRH